MGEARLDSGLIVPAHVAQKIEQEKSIFLRPCWQGKRPDCHAGGLPPRAFKEVQFPKGRTWLPSVSEEPFRYVVQFVHSHVEGSSKTLCGLPDAIDIDPDEWAQRYGREGVSWCGGCKHLMAAMLGQVCCEQGAGIRAVAQARREFAEAQG